MTSDNSSARPPPVCPDAVFERYAQRLVALAEQQLSPRLAPRLDGEDVVQSVFRTFFRRCARGEFHIDTSAQLWRLLVTLTLRKAQARARQHLAGKRRVGAEAPGGSDAVDELAGREPGPEDAAALLDQLDALLAGLPGRYARLVDLRLQGHSVADIAQRLDLSRQSVYRGLALLGRRLTASLAEGAAEKS